MNHSSSSSLFRDAWTPLVRRELLSLARKRWTYWGRLLTATGACITLAYLAWAGDPSLVRLDNGRPVVVLMFYGLYLVATVGGLRSTCNCISRERREGTLGLLFLTDLNSRNVLLAKLISSSLQNFGAMLAVFPILAICFVAGGVDAGLYLRGALAILITLWVSCAMGLYQSCLTEDDHMAFSKSVRAVILCNLIPLVSPYFLVATAASFRSGYFWASLIPSFLVGLDYWVKACQCLAKNWRGLPATAPAVSKPVMRSTDPGSGLIKWIESATTAVPKKCGNQNPNRWILSRYRDVRQVSPVAIGRVLLVASGFFLFLAFKQDFESFTMAYLIFMGCCRVIVVATACKIAPGGWAEVLKGSGMEILLTTPLTVGSLINAARRMLLREFAHPLVVILGFDVLVLTLASIKGDRSGVFSLDLPFTLMLTEVLFVTSLLAMGSLGIWFGLLFHRSTSAVNATFVAGLVLALATFYASSAKLQVTAVILLIECVVILVVSHFGIHHYVRKSREGTKT